MSAKKSAVWIYSCSATARRLIEETMLSRLLKVSLSCVIKCKSTYNPVGSSMPTTINSHSDKKQNYSMVMWFGVLDGS